MSTQTQAIYYLYIIKNNPIKKGILIQVVNKKQATIYDWLMTFQLYLCISIYDSPISIQCI